MLQYYDFLVIFANAKGKNKPKPKEQDMKMKHLMIAALLFSGVGAAAQRPIELNL